MIARLILACLSMTAPAMAGSLPQGYAVSAGTTIWSAGGSGANNGVTSISSSANGTASCGSLTTVTHASIDNSMFPGTAVTPIPSTTGSFVKIAMSGGASGGECVIGIDVVDFVPGNMLIGQFLFFAPGYNNNSNGISMQMTDNAYANRLVMYPNINTAYIRRQEGWNLVQGYCTPALTSPAWHVESGTPTCASTTQFWFLRLTVAANTTITVYLGDIMKGYYAKPQITVWGADGWNSVYSVLYPYMATRGLKGSYAPTSGEINQGPDPMPLANLLALAAAGWSIHPHQSTSVVGDYTGLAPSALAAELELVKSQFTSQGIPMSSFYYPPGGSGNLAVIAAMHAAGFSGLGSSGNAAGEANGRPIYGGLISWNGQWNVAAEALSLSAIKTVIDHAISHGEQLSLLWHTVSDANTCTISCTKSVIDYLYVLQQAGLVDVVTWDQLVRRHASPRQTRQ